MIAIMVVASAAFGAGLFLVLRARQRLSTIETSPMVQASQVAALAAMGSTRCEITGTARSGERGLLTSPVTDQPCVWHKVAVQAVHLDPYGVQVGEPEDLVTEDASSAPIVLEEQDGVVVVDMREADVMVAQRATVRIDAGVLEQIDPDIAVAYDENTRFERVEWMIPEGAQLFVSGKPVSVGDQVGIGTPEDGEVVVSTESDAADALTAAAHLKTGKLLMASAVFVAVVSFFFA